MIYSLSTRNQSWDKEVKAKRISEWDQAQRQRLGQDPSSRLSLPVSILRHTLDVLGTGSNSTLFRQLYTYIISSRFEYLMSQGFAL